MDIPQVVYSVAALSWIDAASGLPDDDGSGPPSVLPDLSKVLTFKDAVRYRFVNLLSAATYGGPEGVGGRFAKKAGLYTLPTFGLVQPKKYKTKQELDYLVQRDGGRRPRATGMWFEQTCGCRTVAPEKLGGLGGGLTGGVAGGVFLGPPGAVVGGWIGRRLGAEVGSVILDFPPIWSRLRLELPLGGSPLVTVPCHSWFPSLTLYVLNHKTNRYEQIEFRDREGKTASHYDGVPNLNRWEIDGWDGGNPWGIRRPKLAEDRSGGSRLRNRVADVRATGNRAIGSRATGDRSTTA